MAARNAAMDCAPPMRGDGGRERRGSLELATTAASAIMTPDGFCHDPIGAKNDLAATTIPTGSPTRSTNPVRPRPGSFDADLGGPIVMQGEHRCPHDRNAVRVAVGGDQLCSPDRHSE